MIPGLPCARLFQRPPGACPTRRSFARGGGRSRNLPAWGSRSCPWCCLHRSFHCHAVSELLPRLTFCLTHLNRLVQQLAREGASSCFNSLLANAKVRVRCSHVAAFVPRRCDLTTTTQSALGFPSLLFVGFLDVIPSLLRVTWTRGSAGVCSQYMSQESARCLTPSICECSKEPPCSFLILSDMLAFVCSHNDFFGRH